MGPLGTEEYSYWDVVVCGYCADDLAEEETYEGYDDEGDEGDDDETD